MTGERETLFFISFFLAADSWHWGITAPSGGTGRSVSLRPHRTLRVAVWFLEIYLPLRLFFIGSRAFTRPRGRSRTSPGHLVRQNVQLLCGYSVCQAAPYWFRHWFYLTDPVCLSARLQKTYIIVSVWPLLNRSHCLWAFILLRLSVMNDDGAWPW